MKAGFLLFGCLFLFSCSLAAKQEVCSVAPCRPGKRMVSGNGTPARQGEDTEKNGDMFTDYIIGPEDVVEVSVWKNEALSETTTVRPDGRISLPLVGDIQAAGLTASQLKSWITQKLLEYKETPTVSVIVKEVNSYVVFITGEVVRPGKYPLKSRSTLLQGITLAGGFTQYASKNKILLLRKNGSGEVRMRIKYSDILSGGDSADPILLPGDTVVVP